MALNRFVTSINPDDNTASILGSTGLAVCEVTSKPPKEEDYNTPEEWQIAYNKHYEEVVTGYEIKRNMIVNNQGITFPDESIQITACKNNLLLAGTATGSFATVPSTLVDKTGFVSSDEANGINTQAILPGGNGNNNSLPESCNSLVFLNVTVDLQNIGLGESVPCYVPCYFNNPNVVPPPVEGTFELGSGSDPNIWTENVLVKLYEGNVGSFGGTSDPTAFPSTIVITARVRPVPTNQTTVIGLTYDTSLFPANNFDTAEYANVLVMNAGNNWQVQYRFTISNDRLLTQPTIGELGIATSSTNTTYNNKTGSINFILHDYEDTGLIEELPEDTTPNEDTPIDETPGDDTIV
uniref:Uncharacterized protein n=1 Tax=viral metagenome TaxID=1070528 RepID=A0A6C0LHH6_9ZZZZ